MKFDLKYKIKSLKEIVPSQKRQLTWKRIGMIYLAFARRHFVEQSKGGGEWPKLKTKRKRNKDANKQLILRDTGFLLQSLSMGVAGNYFDANINSVTVGFDKVPHAGDNDATLREIAVYHNEGAGNLPQREILVEPDAATQKRMIVELQRMFNE